MIEEDILAKLISDKSGVSRSEAQTQLNELGVNIKSVVDAGEVFEMEGFGTFKKERNATVFEPDEVLQTEINQKYAGMRPIELIGSFKETAAAQPVEQVETPVPVEVEEVVKEPLVEISANGTEPPAEQAEPVVSIEDKKKVLQESSPPPPVQEKRGEKEAGESETGRASVVLIIAAIVAAILLAGWLLYSTGVFLNGKTARSVPVRNTQGVVVDNNVSNKPDGVANEDVSKATNAVYGLRGAVQPEAKDGFTIIVHSLWRKKHAFETLDAIKAKGYRALIQEANVGDQMYWRIGIGQFKTIKDAKKAIKSLPEPYKSNNFIKQQ